MDTWVSKFLWQRKRKKKKEEAEGEEEKKKKQTVGSPWKCYSIFSFGSMYSDSGHFGVYAGTSADTANEMLAVTAQQLADIAAGVGDDEIERAKAQLRASLVMSRESVSGCGDSLARQIMMFGAPQDDAALLDSIIAVDAAAVRDVAADLIAGGRPAVTAIGPEAEIMSNEDLAAIFAGGSA